ncbi:MAG: fimbrillin family protein [Bacteroidales bacterium]|nr:fimbrillin family protein [Bacteroidales bacterium]
MKKNILSLLTLCIFLAITALTSCQEEEKTSGIQPERNRMVFSLGVDTRRPMVSTSITEVKYFWLVANTYSSTTPGERDTIYCGQAMYDGEKVTLYNEDYLEEDGSLLWPEDKDQEVNIYAIQEPDDATPDSPDPMAMSLGIYNGSIPIFLPLTIEPSNDTPQEPTEILVAHVVNSFDDSSEGIVTLTFKHILTQIQVSTKVADDGYFYRIKSMYIKGCKHGAYRINEYTEEFDGWIASTQFLDTTCNYIHYNINSNYSPERIRESISNDAFWQEEWDLHYIYFPDDEENDYLDVGAYQGDSYVTLMGTDFDGNSAPLNTFILPVGYANELNISYSVWTKETNAEDGSIVAGEKVEDFNYKTYLNLKDGVLSYLDPGKLITLQLHFKAFGIEFAGDNEEGMKPD